MQAYLDNAATTRVFAEVKEIMGQVMESDFGNPSSKHTMGITAEGYIKQAKEQIAASLKCRHGEIIFTSGGTESNNLALIGTAAANKRAGRHIITTAIEHPSVHEPLAFLERKGYEVTYLPVDENGQVSPEQMKKAVRKDTILASVMHVNNETGSTLQTEELAKAFHQVKPEALFHVDAVQGYGKYKLAPKKQGIDLLSVSGHKIHGPKGTGFLYVREGVKILPILFGGGQQKGMRPGTENVPGIAGLGRAAMLMYAEHGKKREKLYALKELLVHELERMEGVTVHAMGAGLENTAPHIVSAGFLGIKSEVMLHALAEQGVYVSSGSACSSHHQELSGTLQAIGVGRELLDATLRFSFSVLTTEEEVRYAADKIREILPVLRRFTRH